MSNGRRMHEPNLIKRAFDLAQSGNYRDIKELEIALRREGYGSVVEHLAAQSLRRQLQSLMRASHCPNLKKAI